MDVIKRILHKLDELKHVSDLAAYCYLEVTRTVHDETSFLGGYWMSGTHVSNPNLPNLKRLGYDISRCVKPMDFYERGRVRRLLEEFEETGIKPYRVPGLQDPDYNEATIPWAVLWGLSEGIASRPEYGELHRIQPLNEYGKEKVGVYLAPHDSFICDILRERKVQRVPDGRLNEMLRGLALYPRSELKTIEYPKIKTIANMENPGREPILKIGLCQLTAAPIFTFDGEDESAFMDFRHIGGGLFDVHYGRDFEQHAYLNVVSPLIDAIEAGCEIVVYPELAMSPQLLEAVKAFLSNPEHDKKALKLVVAGSGRPGNERDNVCTLLKCDGEVLGTCHKFSKFIDLGDPPLVEQLDHPGATNTLVDIAGVGRVLVGICKDLASDGERVTLEIAHALKPQVVCVPALSQSVDKAFSIALHELTVRKHAIGCVCNLCAARKQYGQSEVGVSCVASFEFCGARGKALDCQIHSITRPKGAQAECAQRLGGCMRVVSLDFNGPLGPRILSNPCPARIQN